MSKGSQCLYFTGVRINYLVSIKVSSRIFDSQTSFLKYVHKYEELYHTFVISCFLFLFFSICHLNASKPALCHFQWDSLTHQILIPSNGFSFEPRVTRNLLRGFVPKTELASSRKRTFQFQAQCLNKLSHSPEFYNSFYIGKFYCEVLLWWISSSAALTAWATTSILPKDCLSPVSL